MYILSLSLVQCARVQSQIRVVSSSSISSSLYYLNTLDRSQRIDLTVRHTHRQSSTLFFSSLCSVCHIYIPRICFVLAHCAIYCCCSLVLTFHFSFNVVHCCHDRSILSLDHQYLSLSLFLFYALFNSSNDNPNTHSCWCPSCNSHLKLAASTSMCVSSLSLSLIRF